MPTAITNDVSITVETAYQNNRLNQFDGHHMFAYRITIENRGDHAIKLLRRHWYIHDISIGKSEVEGEGVVGLQPRIEPGSSHQYVSGCSLESEFGMMYGTYLMERLDNESKFEVRIPEFSLIAPYRHN
jgi:ApaG protein